MHMLCYLPPDLPATHPVRRLLINAPSSCTREVYDSLSSLERRLSRPGEPHLFLALAITSEADLDGILKMAHLCQQRSLLLILPQPEPALQAKAHRLRPRYMTCLDGDPEELSAVLHRLVTVYETDKGGSPCNRINPPATPQATWALKANF